MAYVNGQFPLALLSPIDSTRMLLSPAAKSWFRVLDEVEDRYGWRPSLSAGATAYRSYAQQRALFLARYTRTFTGIDMRVWDSNNDGIKETWWRLPGVYSAATPGQSNHGLGVAVDVSSLGGFSGTRYAQFASVASKHGWNNDEGKRINEAWHWVYVPSADQNPTPTPPEDDVSVEDVIVGLASFFEQTATRSTPTGRAAGTNFINTIAPMIQREREPIADAVWGRTISRGADEKIPALQELADTKTFLIESRAREIALQAQVSGLVAAVTALAEKTGDGTGIDVDALVAAVRQAAEDGVRETLDTGLDFDVVVTPRAVDNDEPV